MADRSDISRRDFLKTAGVATAAAAGASLVGAARADSAASASASRVLGANDRIQVGIVGVKGMGGGHIKHILEQMPDENVAITAICDVWEQARLKANEATKLPEDRVFEDYRRLLDAKDVDVVLVATPDHWHSRIAVDALESGRHVYCEKPMTRHLDEAFKVLDTSRKTGRLVQLGTQGCTEPKYLAAREMVQSGALGRLLWAQASYCRNNPQGEWNYDIDPAANETTVDWRQWLGPAPKRSWSPERYFRWRKYWDYGTGVIGDLLPHRLAPLMMAMNIEEYPQAVSCVGGNLCDTDKGPGKDGKPYGERREVADTQLVLVQFPSGISFFLVSDTVNERGVEDVIRGQKANITMGGGKVVLEPERPYSDDVERKDVTATEPEHSHANHVKNFLEALRGNEKQHAPVELGARVQAIVSMAEKAYREQKLVRFDAASRKMRT